MKNRLDQIIVKSLALLLIAFAIGNASAQTLLNPNTVSGTLAPGEYYHPSSITLSADPGFTFTAGPNSSLHLFISNCIPLATNMSGDQNYVSTLTLRKDGFTNNNQLVGLNTCDAIQTVQYIDGLGRLQQTVQVKGNQDATKDLVQPVAYDALGREAQKYLPYTQTTANPGGFHSAALSEQTTFYSQTGMNYKNMSTPWSTTMFELSPLNRPIEQGAPGSDWQLGQHTIGIAYMVNDQAAISFSAGTGYAARIYKVTVDANRNRSLIDGGANYDAGQLTVTVSHDENYMGSGKAGTVEEYKDKEEHTILKRTFNHNLATGNDEMLSTYYVYDDLDKLAFVLPPGALPDAGLSSATTPDKLNSLCYQYSYDERNRLVKKRLPGKEWEYIVYNKLDQPVLSQDGRQHQINQWKVIKYDGAGRVIMTGLWNPGTVYNPLELQTSINAAAQWDNRDYGNTSIGYSISSYPIIDNILTINYYDDYNNIPNMPAAYDQHSSYSSMIIGLATATSTAILLPNGSVSSDRLLNVLYYDDKGRNVKTISQHYLGGVFSLNNYDEVSSTYNFDNSVATIIRQHYSKNSANTAATLSLTVDNNYTYDHMGRKRQTWSQINGGANILLNQTDYNEIGQMVAKHLHSTDSGNSYLQSTSYTYNERGWLLESSAPLFEEQLQYNSVNNVSGISPVAQYNGNIASQSWGTASSSNGTSYVYRYDSLNRLIDGSSTDNYNEKNISYDKIGNIKTLQRYWNNSLIDDLTYNYTDVSSNRTTRLQTISDATTSDMGLKHGINQTYGYDANGNMNSDASKGLDVTYNMLNLPATNTLAGGTISYTYSADGKKLRKLSILGSGSTIDYIDGIQYTNGTIDFVQTEEGRVMNLTGTPNYEYTLTDHLSNSRVTFDSSTGLAKQTDDYYPFGMEISRGTIPSPKNEYLYNKKELQEELGQYDYGARFYDPVIARWTSVDNWAEHPDQIDKSPYAYVVNNPIRYDDPDGNCGPCLVPLIWAVEAIADYVTVETVGATIFAAGSTAIVMHTVNSAQRNVAASDNTRVTSSVPLIAPTIVNTNNRDGKDFTPKGKKTVIDDNKAKNNGQTVCENCGVKTTKPEQSKKGQTPPSTDTQVDHKKPKSKGGSGTPDNGQVLCRDCNIKKGDKEPTPPQPHP